MASGTQTNLIEFNVEFYQPGDEIYVGKDEELFEDGCAGGFVDGVKSYEDAIEKDETYKNGEGEGEFRQLGTIGRDEKFIVKTPFYVLYVLNYMGGDGRGNSYPATWAEMEVENTSKWDVFDDRFIDEIIKLAKPDFEQMCVKPEKPKGPDGADWDWMYVEPCLNDKRQKDQPLSLNIITVWNFSYYHFSGMDGDDFDADWELLGRLDLGGVAKRLSDAKSPVSPAAPAV